MTSTQISDAKRSIHLGSQSFSFASFFLPKKSRHEAWLLYSWCRFVDDQIDAAPNVVVATARLENLRSETRRAIETEEPLTIAECENLRTLHRRSALPLRYPLDLLEGMQMDLDGFVYETETDLRRYCYCVAGTVGIMMCHVMGVSDDVAFEHALSLGVAMQMTNICRDVHDDFLLGRIYFPRTWMTPEEFRTFSAGADNGLWSKLCHRLLKTADLEYSHARAGLRYLAIRPALAIAVALCIYRAIGRHVLRKKSVDWQTRAWVRPWEKFFYFISQFIQFLPRVFASLVVKLKRGMSG